jgi:hypothetical protein
MNFGIESLLGFILVRFKDDPKSSKSTGHPAMVEKIFWFERRQCP